MYIFIAFEHVASTYEIFKNVCVCILLTMSVCVSSYAYMRVCVDAVQLRSRVCDLNVDARILVVHACACPPLIEFGGGGSNRYLMSKFT